MVVSFQKYMYLQYIYTQENRTESNTRNTKNYIEIVKACAFGKYKIIGWKILEKHKKKKKKYQYSSQNIMYILYLYMKIVYKKK